MSDRSDKYYGYRRDELRSALIKSILRQKPTLAIEIAKCYGHRPSDLKADLLELCCEYIPNFFVVNELSAAVGLSAMVNYIPTLCLHKKFPYMKYILRVICEQDPDFGEIMLTDDLVTSTSKCWTRICLNDYTTINNTFADVLPKERHSIALERIVMYSLAIKYFPDFTTNSFERQTIVSYYSTYPTQLPKDVTVEDVQNLDKINLKKIPNWAYDMTVYTSPISQKSYAFYFDNLVVENLYEVPKNIQDLVKYGKERYLTTRRGIRSYIDTFVQCKEIEAARLIHYPIAKYSSQLYFLEKVDISSTMEELTRRQEERKEHQESLKNLSECSEVPTEWFEPHDFKYIVIGPYGTIDKLRKPLIAQYVKSLIEIPDYLKFVPVRYHNSMFLLASNPWKDCPRFLDGIDRTVHKEEFNWLSTKKLKYLADKSVKNRDKSIRYEFEHIPNFSGWLFKWEHDYIYHITDEEFLTLAKNVLHQQLVSSGWCATRKIIMSRPPACENAKINYPEVNYDLPIKFWTLSDDISQKQTLTRTLFADPPGELEAREYHKKLKAVWQEMYSWIITISEKITRDQLIEINEKAYMLRQLITLSKIENWMFN